MKLPIDFKISGSWVLLFGNTSTTILNFVFFAILSHQLTPDQYGSCREIFLFANLLVTLCVAGFAQTINYFLNFYKEDVYQLKVIGQIRILILLTQFAIVALTLFAYLLNTTNYLNISTLDLILFLLYCFFTSITLIDINLSVIYKKNKFIVLSNFIWVAFKIVLLLLLINSAISISYVLLISVLIQVLIFISNQITLGKYYWGIIDLKKLFASKIINNLMAYNVPLALSVFIGFLTSNTDRFLLKLFNPSNAQFAILSNVSFEVPFIANIYTSFFTISLPYLVKAYSEKNISNLIYHRKEYIKKVSILVFPIVLAFMFWHSEFIGFAFGNKYVAYSHLFAIYSLISLMRVCSHIDILLATNHTKYIFYIQIVELFLRIIISSILYQYFGLAGFIYAAVATNLLYFLITNYINANILQVNFISIFPNSYLIKNLLFFALIGIVIKLFFSQIVNNWYLEIFTYSLVSILYVFYTTKAEFKYIINNR